MISYRPPDIADHGSLVDLTADFDLHFVGSVAKIVSLAAVSPAIIGGTPGGGESAQPSGAGGVLQSVGTPGGGSGGGGGGAADVLGDGPSAGADVGAGSPTAGGDVAGVSAGGDGGGDLPFTGYYAMLTAAAGATLATAGTALRAKLRRKS